jgi:hypothetical protein
MKRVVKEDLPALLILGSESRSDSNLRNQIPDSLQLSSDFTFYEFLAVLDNLGFLNNTKVPTALHKCVDNFLSSASPVTGRAF